jgi:hypothetical protein
MGREVIAGIPQDMGFCSRRLPSFTYQDSNGNVQEDIYGGRYNWQTNTLEMNTDLLDKDFQYYSYRTDFLFHELLHAYQKQNGIMLLDNPSIEQSLVSQKLIEAEAAAWNDVLGLTREVSLTNSYHLTQQDINYFMERDLEQEGRETAQILETNFDVNEFRKTDRRYLFQQALKACNGNCDEAQRMMVGRIITQRMQERDTQWTHQYNSQAIEATEQLARMNKISQNGNRRAYDRMLSYYRERYNVQPHEIQNLHLSSYHRNRVASLRNDMNRSGRYSDSNQSSHSRQSQLSAMRRNRGR